MHFFLEAIMCNISYCDASIILVGTVLVTGAARVGGELKLRSLDAGKSVFL
jgi:hypothetical protein